MHLQGHAFEDIKAKGATQNYNTKPNEKLHRPLRDAYQLRTNYKDVAAQVRVECICVYSLLFMYFFRYSERIIIYWCQL